MKNFLAKHRFRILFTLIGLLCGLGYWHFIGCTSGTCPITSHWHTMGGYGTIMGYLVGDIINSKSK